MSTNIKSTGTIYVVDDDEAVRDSLIALLESHGLSARAFGSGADFLVNVVPADRGCIVLDLHLPIVGGLQILHSLARANIRMPVIVITGGGDGKSASLAREAGAWIVMEKPLDHRRLVANIIAAIGRDSPSGLALAASR